MNLRPAQHGDTEQIKHVVFSVLKEYGLTPDSKSTDQDLDAIEAHYFLHNGFFGVVEFEGNIVATVGLHRVDGTTCELRKMYCLPQHRGRGLGRFLIEFALTKACELGYTRIILETASPLKEAISLYKKYGFQEFTPEHLAARCDQAFELYL
ncbi:MAG TPA: GNAT family N-acetyltransferase [Cellvibrionaceae bacterium]|nr:GNAT family N-acetyltransferase [Cellvibrionaceae bacterium]